MPIDTKSRLLWPMGTEAMVEQVVAAFPRVDAGTYIGHEPTAALAADFMIPEYKTTAGKAYGDRLADWVWERRAEYDLWYQIWRGRIRSMTYPNAGWKPYTPKPAAIAKSPDSAWHRNHVHVSLYNEPETAMAISDADAEKIARAVLRLDGEVKNTGWDGTPGNTHVAMRTALSTLGTRLAAIEKKLGL